MTRRIGRYRLEEELGRGGMGTVFRAFDELLLREVALKLMHVAEATREQRERFRVEARAIARLRSPHVVEVYDFDFTEGSTPYIVMELLRGESLAERLLRVRALSLPDLVKIGVALCEGLAVSHAAGVVHRDLKPQNIFLVAEGREVRAKILDFGVALIRSEREQGYKLTGEHQLPGTPSYMSPEQIQGAPLDHRSDLWSLGVICYEALAGSNPFATAKFASTMRRVVMEAPPSLAGVVPGAGHELDAFFARALAKSPSDRFQSALQLAKALRSLSERLEEPRSVQVLVVHGGLQEGALERSVSRAPDPRRYRFAFAETGPRALEWVGQHGAPDVVLTVPDAVVRDGLTLVEALRPYASTRSIVVAAPGDLAGVRQAMNRGAFDCLVEPLDEADLASTLARAADAADASRSALRSERENATLRQLLAPDLAADALTRLGDAGGSVLYGDWGTVVCAASSQRRELDSKERFVDELNASLDTLAAIVGRSGGTVTRYLGTVTIVVFRGTDHEARALKACVELRDTLSTERSSRRRSLAFGVDSGELIAALVGAPSQGHFDCSVFGEAVHAALAMSHFAEPDEIFVTPLTWEAARLAGFRAFGLGPFRVGTAEDSPSRSRSLAEVRTATPRLPVGKERFPTTTLSGPLPRSADSETM